MKLKLLKALTFTPLENTSVETNLSRYRWPFSEVKNRCHWSSSKLRYFRKLRVPRWRWKMSAWLSARCVTGVLKAPQRNLKGTEIARDQVLDAHAPRPTGDGAENVPSFESRIVPVSCANRLRNRLKREKLWNIKKNLMKFCEAVRVIKGRERKRH